MLVLCQRRRSGISKRLSRLVKDCALEISDSRCEVDDTWSARSSCYLPTPVSTSRQVGCEGAPPQVRDGRTNSNLTCDPVSFLRICFRCHDVLMHSTQVDGPNRAPRLGPLVQELPRIARGSLRDRPSDRATARSLSFSGGASIQRSKRERSATQIVRPQHAHSARCSASTTQQ